MTRLLSLVMLGLFSVAIVGCRASVDVDDPDDVNDVDHDNDRTMKKTTTYDSDGNVVHKESTMKKD